MIFDQSFLDSLIQAVESSRKYRDLHIPHATLRDILACESSHSNSRNELEANFRKSLHNVMAPYLEDINYLAQTAALKELRDQNPSQESLKSWCLDIMHLHASSRERLPYLDAFYQKIFAVIGPPDSILDLACALDPLGLPWMNLPPSTKFFAYDIHQPRLDFLQTFFQYFNPQANAIHQDILTNIPEQIADCAFFFKEAHRLEKRRPGSNRALWQALRSEIILVSLPSSDIGKTHDMSGRMENLVFTSIAGLNWSVEKMFFPDEIVFCIHKGSEQHE
jgi:16S rRNA (guanine(1405)-N(7))-methyltransferase